MNPLVNMSLNPFFIRSAVGMKLMSILQYQVSVLIPSSSGLRLESPTRQSSDNPVCLNPFFIRSAVGILGVMALGIGYTS